MENKTTRRGLLGFYHYGVILTYLSVVSAIFGICFSVGGFGDRMPWAGVFCLLFSGICDSFDGRVARTRKNRTPEDLLFGERIDSLSDVIAFGVAPTMIGYGMGLNQIWMIPIYALFVLGALCRLAYFDVTEETRMKQGAKGPRKYYEGMPVTNVSFIIPIAYMIATLFVAGGVMEAVVMAVVYLATAISFVTPFKMMKPSVKQIFLIIFGTAAVLGVLFGLHAVLDIGFTETRNGLLF